MARSPHGGEQLFGVAEGDVLRDPPVAQVQDAVARGNRALHVVRDHEDDAALVRELLDLPADCLLYTSDAADE